MIERKRDFAMEFVGFANYSGNMTEASIAIHPDFDLVGVTSTLVSKEDGSRVIILIFQKAEKILGRRAYSLKQEWEQLPDGQQTFANDETRKTP